MRVKKYYKLVRIDYEDSAYMRLKNVSNEAGIFKMGKNGTPTAPNLEYSLDGVTWTTYDFSTLPEVAVAAGANIYFRGNNSTGFYKQNFNYYRFYFTFNKTCEGHGNMCSLLNSDPAVFSTITSIPNYGLAFCFENLTSLTTAPDLSSVTTIGNYGLQACFRGCTSLNTAPDMSNVTSIGTYGLSTAFQGCTSLTAHDLSSLTTISNNGLQSCFEGCTSLTAPDLSNVTTIGESGLNSCFKGCTSLITGPDLSNVTSVSNYGLQNAFNNCSKLSTVTAPNVQDLTTNYILNSWLNNAGSQATGTKTVNVPTGATITTGSNDGIPTGWTRVDY